jgi:four helix bundle protein
MIGPPKPNPQSTIFNQHSVSGDLQSSINNNQSGGGMIPDLLKKRTKGFAHGCVKLAVALPRTTLGRHIEKQLVRCGTSVASNYRATLLAQTKAAFISKISIVIEEVDESEFWLEFIIDEGLLEKDKILPLLNEAHELASIFIASRRTAQKRIVDR